MRNHKQHETNPFELPPGIDSEQVFTIPLEHLTVIAQLSKTASKILLFLVEHSYKSEGIIYFDIKESKFELEFKENKSIYNGLSELINKDVIAGRKSSDEFYYNQVYFDNYEKV